MVVIHNVGAATTTMLTVGTLWRYIHYDGITPMSYVCIPNLGGRLLMLEFILMLDGMHAGAGITLLMESTQVTVLHKRRYYTECRITLDKAYMVNFYPCV